MRYPIRARRSMPRFLMWLLFSLPLIWAPATLADTPSGHSGMNVFLLGLGSDGQTYKLLVDPTTRMLRVQDRPSPCTPVDRSFTSAASQAVTLAASNSTRSSLTIQIPSSLSSGIWISWSGTASNGGAGSYFFAAGTPLLTLDVTVVGQGPISVYTTTGSVIVPATEC